MLSDGQYFGGYVFTMGLVADGSWLMIINMMVDNMIRDGTDA